MVKRLFSLVIATIAAVLCSFSTVAYADKYEDYHLGVLVDYQDALTDYEEEELLLEIQSAADETGVNVGVVLTNGLDGRSSQGFTDRFLDEWFGEYSDSIVLMLVKSGTGEQDWISCTNKAYDIYIDRKDAIFDAIYTGLDRGGNNYPEAIREFCSYIKSHKSAGLHISLNMVTLFGLVFSLVFALCTVNGIAAKYRKKAPISARRYLDSSMTRFTERNDVFVREYTTSVKISSSSGGRSGGGRSGGSHRGGGGGRRR